MSENTTTSIAGDVTPSQRLKSDSQALFRFAERLWYGEARAHCASNMFYELREHWEALGVDYDDLCGPIDYEYCLDGNGFELSEGGNAWVETAYREALEDWHDKYPKGGSENDYRDWTDAAPVLEDYTHTEETDPEDACADLGLDAYEYEREVFEHWIVDDWFADRLEMVGEKCPEILGLRVWLRTTTGQSVALDSCLHSVVFSLLDGNGASGWWAKYGEGL